MTDNLRKVFHDRKCRECGETPEEGYYISRIARNDWICPTCCNNHVKTRRENRTETFESEIKED